MEVNGTKGDLVVSSPVGYVGIGGFVIKGARQGETMHELQVPPHYGADRFEEGPSQGVALAYERMAADMHSGSKLSATFNEALNCTI